MRLDARAGTLRGVATFWLTMLFIAGVNPSRAEAQGLGYGVAGPAGVSGFFASNASQLHAAGGGELVAANRVGVGGEFGVFGRTSVLLVLSVNGTVHLGGNPETDTLVPYISSGYSRLGIGDGDRSFAAWNIAAGVDYWAGRRTGFRAELRGPRPPRRSRHRGVLVVSCRNCVPVVVRRWGTAFAVQRCRGTAKAAPHVQPSH
jgi:hypothetical protein